MEDILSDILRLVKLKSCVYFLSEFRSPWGMHMDAGPFAQFHLLARGRICLTMAGTSRQLNSGDVVILPRGAAHALSDQADRETVPGLEVLHSINTGAPHFADGGEAATLLCGHFEFDRDIGHPLIEALPQLIHIPAFDLVAPGWLESVGPVLVRETNVKLPGSETIAERLAEVLLIQVLRAYLPTLGQSRGFLGALTDARLSRAVKLIHNHAGDALTLEELARAAGMSRSNLALRFKQDLGIAPMTYLTQWRLLTAREMLRHSTASVADVAARVGYRSDVAFARAFKRAYDVTPAVYRRTPV